MQALAELAKPIQEAKLAADRAAAEAQPSNAAILRQPPKPRVPATKRKEAEANRLDQEEPEDDDEDN
eukprot:6862996-Heterocapsa_arctica.AAC.1